MKEKAPTKVVDEEPLVAAARNTNDFTTFAIFMVSGDYFAYCFEGRKPINKRE